jgi:hypothetical protein
VTPRLQETSKDNDNINNNFIGTPFESKFYLDSKVLDKFYEASFRSFRQQFRVKIEFAPKAILTALLKIRMKHFGKLILMKNLDDIFL